MFEKLQKCIALVFRLAIGFRNVPRRTIFDVWCSDPYEANVERDVYMTFKLWESWKAGKLKTLDGYEHR